MTVLLWVMAVAAVAVVLVRISASPARAVAVSRRTPQARPIAAGTQATLEQGSTEFR